MDTLFKHFSLFGIIGLMLLSNMHPVASFLLDTNNFLSRCPSGVPRDQYARVFQDKCYQFVLTHSKYWQDASADCQSRGGNLVIVDHASIQTFIIHSLEDMGNTHHGIWLGLTDKKHELHWIWVNGEPLSGYNNWARHQGGANILHLTQDCAMIRLDDHGLWHDRECHLWPNRYPYICQYDLLPSSTTSSTKTSVATPASTAQPTIPTKDAIVTKIIEFTQTTKTELRSQPTTQSSPMSTYTPTSTLSSSLTTLEATETSYISRILSSKLTSAIPTKVVSKTPESTELAYTSPIAKLVTDITTAAKVTDRIADQSTEVTYLTPNTFTEVTTRTPKHPSDLVTTPASLLSMSTVDLESIASTITTTVETLCSQINCKEACPHGYMGVYVGLDGCITCRCK